MTLFKCYQFNLSQSLSFFLVCSFFISVSCSQQKVSSTAEERITTLCKDSAIAFKQTIITGNQKTDINGNPIDSRNDQYRLFLFSAKQNIKIDSIIFGNTGIKTFNTNLVLEKPLYKDAEKKIVLVHATDCSVLQITVDSPVAEINENKVTIYYSKDKIQNEIIILTITDLDKNVVE